MAQAKYDVFISHASEDKETFVRPFVRRLLELGLSVWYDEFQIFPGDSLRRSLDEGLAKSKYVVAVLSPTFFKKKWTQNELSAIFAQESGKKGNIIPIWLGVSTSQVSRFSPMLADRVAITKTDPHLAADEVVRALHRHPLKSGKTISLNTQTTVEFKFDPNVALSGLTHSITGPINALVPSVLEFMSDRIKHKSPAKGLTAVIRELLVNAIAHRDYTHPNNIFVIVSEDLVKVTSPGMLPTPLKLKDLKYAHAAIARNSKLSYDLYKLGYMELFGMGLQSLQRELQKRGWPAPCFAHRNGHFVVEIQLRTDLTKS